MPSNRAPKTNAAHARLNQHLWAHRDDLFTFLCQPGLAGTLAASTDAARTLFGVLRQRVSEATIARPSEPLYGSPDNQAVSALATGVDMSGAPRSVILE